MAAMTVDLEKGQLLGGSDFQIRGSLLLACSEVPRAACRHYDPAASPAIAMSNETFV
jgi:hypothetical protein